jgi:hypothetical protein
VDVAGFPISHSRFISKQRPLLIRGFVETSVSHAEIARVMDLFEKNQKKIMKFALINIHLLIFLPRELGVFSDRLILEGHKIKRVPPPCFFQRMISLR